MPGHSAGTPVRESLLEPPRLVCGVSPGGGLCTLVSSPGQSSPKARRPEGSGRLQEAAWLETDRLLSSVMSFPAEGVESAIKNNIEDVRLFLDAKHPGRYAVYNLSPRTYRASKFHNRVSGPAHCGGTLVAVAHLAQVQVAMCRLAAVPHYLTHSRRLRGDQGLGHVRCGRSPGPRQWGWRAHYIIRPGVPTLP